MTGAFGGGSSLAGGLFEGDRDFLRVGKTLTLTPGGATYSCDMSLSTATFRSSALCSATKGGRTRGGDRGLGAVRITGLYYISKRKRGKRYWSSLNFFSFANG